MVSITEKWNKYSQGLYKPIAVSYIWHHHPWCSSLTDSCPHSVGGAITAQMEEEDEQSLVLRENATEERYQMLIDCGENVFVETADRRWFYMRDMHSSASCVHELMPVILCPRGPPVLMLSYFSKPFWLKRLPNGWHQCPNSVVISQSRENMSVSFVLLHICQTLAVVNCLLIWHRGLKGTKCTSSHCHYFFPLTTCLKQIFFRLVGYFYQT